MNESMKVILEKIKEYKKILIFRHFRPDGDAIGSTKGLARILKLTYPDKEIYLQNADFSNYLAFLGGEDELLPWDNIDIGVTKEFLLRERHRAHAETTTRNCRETCNGCGANHLGGERSCCPSLKK